MIGLRASNCDGFYDDKLAEDAEKLNYNPYLTTTSDLKTETNTKEIENDKEGN